MVDAWVEFIKTGRPGTAGWPAFVQPSFQHLELGDTVSVQSSESADIEFFRELFESMASGGQVVRQ